MSEGRLTGPDKPVVFSGMQPSGEAHLGNYLGALRQWVALQEDHDCYYCIVDQHAIAAGAPAELLPRRTFDLAVSFLAVGLDPEKCTIFVQSDVSEHTELAWLFNAVTPVGDLERMIQYKEKSAHLQSVPAGLLNYPILQAADILLYRAALVPVGEDQLQHLELTRDIARKWNARYGELFPEPQPVVTSGTRIMGLDGQAKMSKSIGNTVGILDEPDEIWGRVRNAVTDPQRVRKTDPGRPEVCNVFALHRLLSREDMLPDIAEKCRAATRGCVDCKRLLSASIVEAFGPFRERAGYYRSRPEEVIAILDAGACRARGVAAATLAAVRRGMGLAWREGLAAAEAD